MMLPPSRTRLYRALLINGFLVLPLLLPAVFSSGAANRTPHPLVVNAQQQSASPAADSIQKFTVTVTDDKGRFIAGLTKEEFAIREGKTDHALSYFNTEDAPASVGLLVDVSGSVNRRALEAAKYAAARFIELSHRENEYFVAEFSSGLRGLTDWTRDGGMLMDALNKLATENGMQPKPKPKGLTALNDAGLAVLEKIAHGGGAHSKHVLLLISDGGRDNDSKHKFDDLKRKIRESDILIYTIIITTTGDIFPDFIEQATMDEFTGLSGGRAYWVNNKKELDEVLEQMALELRQQYVIGFKPTNAAGAGKWNKFKIKLTPRDKKLKNLYVRSREGYFSPPASP